MGLTIDFDPRRTPYIHQATDGLVYVWHGGPYIDVCTQDQAGNLLPTDININVWDYSSDRASVGYTPTAFLATVYDHRGEPAPTGILLIPAMSSPVHGIDPRYLYLPTPHSPLTLVPLHLDTP